MLVSDPTKFADIQRRLADVQNTYFTQLREGKMLKAMTPHVFLEYEWLVEEVQANLPELKLNKESCDRLAAAVKQVAELKSVNKEAIDKGRFVRETDPKIIDTMDWLAKLIAGSLTAAPQPRRKKKAAKAKAAASPTRAEVEFAEAL